MNKFWIWILCALCPAWLLAQQNTEYNRKGDEAMKRLDYSDARLFYSEGLFYSDEMSYCDLYSIQQLTAIWTANESMRASMHNLMNRCLSCLNVKATENDTTAIALLVRYYTDGIGTNPSDEMAAHWSKQLDDLAAPPPAEILPTTPSYVQPIPKEDPFRFFAGYTFTTFAPVGITAGIIRGQWGGYLRLGTNLSFQDYETSFEGKEPTDVPDETLLKPIERTCNAFIATAGVVFSYEPFNLTLGAGYWKRDVLFRYEEVTDTGAATGIYSQYRQIDASHQGIAVDLNSIIEIGRCYVAIGANLLNYTKGNQFKLKADWNVGAGFFF
ncbi:MAG: hypothetical protein LBS05_11240 [Tannerellaceae bacterium]|jgi:hypothetical protein|nr:hypothetical protein [Tannerellaceae bacterium]